MKEIYRSVRRYGGDMLTGIGKSKKFYNLSSDERYIYDFGLTLTIISLLFIAILIKFQFRPKGITVLDNAYIFFLPTLSITLSLFNFSLFFFRIKNNILKLFAFIFTTLSFVGLKESISLFNYFKQNAAAKINVDIFFCLLAFFSVIILIISIMFLFLGLKALFCKREK